MNATQSHASKGLVLLRRASGETIAAPAMSTIVGVPCFAELFCFCAESKTCLQLLFTPSVENAKLDFSCVLGQLNKLGTSVTLMVQ